MVAVCILFASAGFMIMKQMGVGLAVAVLIDGTKVRAVLLPAMMKLLDDWNRCLPEGRFGGPCRYLDTHRVARLAQVGRRLG